jgi:hypothetical protein
VSDQPASPGRIRRLLELPAYPFLFGAYAVFFLWSQNVNKVRTVDVLPPLLFVTGATAVVFAVWWLLLRNAWKSAIVTGTWAFLFFSFGHVFKTVTSAAQVARSVPHEEVWLTLWAAIAIAVVGAVILAKREGRRLSFVLNVVLGVLVLLSISTIGMQKVQARRVQARSVTSTVPAAPSTEAPAAAPTNTTSAAGPKRDIYYLVIEEYPNERILREDYSFDNTPFLTELRKRGFYIPEKMNGPYPKTPHAVSSTLNLNYLSFPKQSSNWQTVYDSLKGSTVQRFLQDRGYKYFLIGSGYHAIDVDPTADKVFEYDPKSGPVQTEFGQVLYDSTVLAAVASRYQVGGLDERHRRYQQLLYLYKTVPEIALDPARTFTFAHMETTHNPYVIDRHGKFISEKRSSTMTSHEAYLESLRYANTRSLELIDRIQAAYPKDEQPIIVFQADEGPGPPGWNPNTKEHFDWTKAPLSSLDLKFGIFSSYYLPGLKDTGLYPEMSTVNSFRLVFNKYFGTTYSMLPDRSYVFRNELEPYNFIDVTDRLK